MMFTVKSQRKNRLAMQFTNELVGRMEFALRELPISTAEETLKLVRDGIPTGDEYELYRESLEVVRVEHPDEDLYIVGVLGKPREGLLRSIDILRTVLYIRPSRRIGQLSEAAELLRRNEPWTLTTLPYEPSPDEADIVARRVSVPEVNFIEDRLRQDLPLLERRLRSMGVRLRPKPRMLIRRRALLDLSFFALRLEFGHAGYPYKPHWRPALRKMQKRIYPERVEAAMLDPRFSKWKKTPWVEEVVSENEVSVDDFQDRIAV